MGQRYFITNTDLENIFFQNTDVSADQGCPESGRSDLTFCPDFRNRIDNRLGPDIQSEIWTENSNKRSGPELRTKTSDFFTS